MSLPRQRGRGLRIYMKIKKILIITIILADISAFSEGKPVIVFDNTVFDFGKIHQKTTVNHTFHFFNKGKGDLVIDRVTRGCACTIVTLSSKEIPPGKRGTLEVQFNTEYSEGKETKTIYVYSNDPDHDVVKLKVKADVLVP